MDSKVLIQNVIISSGTVGQALTQFTKNINIPFLPDEVKVVFINFVEAGNSNESYLVYTDMISDTLGVAIDYKATSTMPGFTFAMHRKPISGTYSFRLVNSTTGVLVTPNGKIIIGLEFKQYPGREKQIKESY
jgi:hypothetical protein